MPRERQEPAAERYEAITAILVIGDDVPEILNEEATELRIYNGPTGKRRFYDWDDKAKAWKRRKDD